jgi:DNA-binding transcriptional ArsR family regulator
MARERRRDTSTARLTDPRQMRALAHPLRLRLLGELRLEGPATATMLAERVDEGVSLVSYHLRQLATHGFVEESPELARDGRERWWRAAHQRTSWSNVEFLDAPERAAAAQALEAQLSRSHAEATEAWLEEAPRWGRAWIDAADMSDWIVELTPEQLKTMRAELAAVIERYAQLDPSPDAERVEAIVHLFPMPRRRR